MSLASIRWDAPCANLPRIRLVYVLRRSCGGSQKGIYCSRIPPKESHTGRVSEALGRCQQVERKRIFTKLIRQTPKNQRRPYCMTTRMEEGLAGYCRISSSQSLSGLKQSQHAELRAKEYTGLLGLQLRGNLLCCFSISPHFLSDNLRTAKQQLNAGPQHQHLCIV